MILTESKICWIGSLATNVIADNTAVAPLIRPLHTRDGQCSTITPLCRTQLPFSTSTPLLFWFPLPLVAQGLCSSGLDGEHNEFTLKGILHILWMSDDLGRFTYMWRCAQKANCGYGTSYELLKLCSYQH